MILTVLFLNRKNTNVALKIIRHDADTREYQIHKHLQTSRIARENIAHPGRTNVIQLLDDFGLGTSHKCLVLDVMGWSVQSEADFQPDGRLPGKTARRVTYQVAQRLDYLWKCGVAHGGGHWRFMTDSSKLTRGRVIQRPTYR